MKTAVVTGGASGIGRATCARLLADGFTLAVCDLDEGGAKESAGPSGLGRGVDVADAGSVEAFFAEVVATLGRIDVLVNNAGISGRARIDDPQAAEVWDRLIDVNLQGLFNVTHACVPALKETRGCIVNLSSIVAFVSGISSAGYVASKGAVRSLTQVLARDLA
ncbi:MAG: SDR family NAD(P)-dependent oxidoreductase, partial [Actinomycetes bacterium]